VQSVPARWDVGLGEHAKEGNIRLLNERKFGPGVDRSDQQAWHSVSALSFTSPLRTTVSNDLSHFCRFLSPSPHRMFHSRRMARRVIDILSPMQKTSFPVWRACTHLSVVIHPSGSPRNGARHWSQKVTGLGHQPTGGYDRRPRYVTSIFVSILHWEIGWHPNTISSPPS